MFDYGADLQNAYDEGYKKGKADAVRHGRWKTYKTEVAGRGFFYCTKCRADAYDATDYCPNCGAKMDEEETNE